MSKINSKKKGSRAEEWKPIKGYEGLYEISNLGRIKRVNYKRMLKNYTNKRNGYEYVGLCKGGIKKTLRVNVLVAEAFIEKLDGSNQVNHKDGVKTNNVVENLEWVTQSENMLHAYKSGLQVPLYKKVIRLDDKKIYDSVKDCAVDMNCSTAAITRVCLGDRSNYKGLRFAHYEDYLNKTIPDFKGKFKKNGVI